jgi:hypothetical protein
MRHQMLLAACLLLPALPGTANAQMSTWADRLAIAERHKVPAMAERRFTHRDFWTAVAPALRSDRLRVAEVGKSMQGRELRTVTFGSGPVKVLLWSQMHGDEATATMALADIFAFLAAPETSALRDRLARELTVVFIPMLNPDGAELFQRHNAVGIDVNRDARQLATPEARTLKSVRDALQPDFGFNLHDQSARTRVGRAGEQAAIALLAPAFDNERSWNPIRSRARLVAAFLADDFGHAVEGRIAKYDDTFNPRAFGDLMQTWGASTVLIESGALPNDPQKQRLRTLNAAAILGALDLIATRSYTRQDPDAYESLPYNSGGASDVLIRGASIVMPGFGPVRADVSLNFDDSVARTGARISEIGDLQTALALDTVDATGKFLHPTPESLTRNDRMAWLRIGSPAAFVIRETAAPDSREVRKVP